MKQPTEKKNYYFSARKLNENSFGLTHAFVYPSRTGSSFSSITLTYEQSASLNKTFLYNSPNKIVEYYVNIGM